MTPPTHDEVEKTLVGLVEGTVTPAGASEWACAFLLESADPPPWDKSIEDALSALAVADALDEPGKLLYGTLDYSDWLNGFRDMRGTS